MTQHLIRYFTERAKPQIATVGKPANAVAGEGACSSRHQPPDGEQRRAMMQCVVENSFDGIAVVSQDGEIEIVNPSAEKMLGRCATDMVGTPIHAYIPWTPEIEAFYDSAASTGEEEDGCRRTIGPCEFNLIREDSVELVIELQVSASRLPATIAGPQGERAPQPVHIYTFRDITERKRLENAQKRSIAEAMAANRAKTEFLANMSHELRTPLNAVIGFSEVIKSQPFGPIGAPQYAEYVDDIFNSGQHLLSVINDILDMSKIEAGEMHLTEAVFNIQTITESCARLISERARRGQVKLFTETSDDLPLLRADERMVKQMLLNLLTNAVKFTPAGGKVDLRAEIDAVGCFVVSIADTGVGIAPKDMEKVLQPFGQADTSLQREFEGTGLGLPLVKSMAELHGAHLAIDSTTDVGTTVTIRFPVARVTARTESCAA